jgi:beta-lactam-binding protein with PASTA domain
VDANVLCDGEDGRVVAQTPPPGTVMDRNQVVRLVCAGAKFATGRLDVQGNQRVREAYRMVPAGPQDDPADDGAVRLGMNTGRRGQPLSLAGYNPRARR